MVIDKSIFVSRHHEPNPDGTRSPGDPRYVAPIDDEGPATLHVDNPEPSNVPEEEQPKKPARKPAARKAAAKKAKK